MIVERWTWTTKVGRRDEFIETFKALIELQGFAGRVCTNMSGPFFAVYWYQEFESMEDRQKVWDAIDWDRPEIKELTDKFSDLVESDVTREILRVR